MCVNDNRTCREKCRAIVGRYQLSSSIVVRCAFPILPFRAIEATFGLDECREAYSSAHARRYYRRSLHAARRVASESERVVFVVFIYIYVLFNAWDRVVCVNDNRKCRKKYRAIVGRYQLSNAIVIRRAFPIRATEAIWTWRVFDATFACRGASRSECGVRVI